jgi:site-specific recombinase XerD
MDERSSLDDPSATTNAGGVAVAQPLRGHDSDVFAPGGTVRQAFWEVAGAIGPEHVRQYLLHLLHDRKGTWGTVQVSRGALKFLYVGVLKQPWFDEEIAAPKRRPRLPTVMSPEDITRILDQTTNLKHWTIIATFYATALRC